MPWFAAIAPIVSAVSGAVGVGESLYSLANQPGGGPIQQPSQTPNVAAQDAQKAAILQQAPNIQSQLGGSVSPDYYASQAAGDTGNPGSQEVAKQVLQEFLGLGGMPSSQGTAPAGAVGSSSQPNYLNFLQPQGSDFGQPGFLEGLSQQQGQNGISGGYGG